MEDGIIELSKYRYQTAVENLETARNNLRDGKYKQAVNRSYYSIFHAIRALTALDGFDSRKHSGIIAYFNRNYVKEGVFDRSASKIIDKAFKIRENADYQDFYVISKNDTEEQIQNAEEFIDSIQKYLISRWDCEE